MDQSRLLLGMAAAFAGMTVLLTMLGIVYNPLILAVAAVFAVVTYVLWEHGTGRLASRVYERVQRQAAANGGRRRRQRGPTGRADPGRGGFGAGPREEWEPPGGDQRRRRRRQDPRGRRTRTGQGNRVATGSNGPSPAEAYQTLDLEQGADQQAVKQAYREKVKDVHPDTDSGDQEQFKEVKAAYERLSED